jgi:hypothetical protein
MFTALNEFFASPAAKKQATKDYHCTRPRRAQTHAFFCLHCSPIICSSSVSNRFVLLPNPSTYALSLVSLSSLAVVFQLPLLHTIFFAHIPPHPISAAVNIASSMHNRYSIWNQTGWH